jgi:glycosyltransferase involved in cell wall biosynthesis
MIPGKVSIIMPCYNAVRYLDDAINSLRGQTYHNIEILAVNDGSTDETQARLEQQAADDSRVRIFAQKNSGPSAARNVGLRHVNGEFVCFLDADDVYLPNKIERQVLFLNAHPHVDLVYSDYYTGDAQLNLTALTAVRITQPDTVEAVGMRNWFPPLVPMFRRRTMEAVGGFDESFRMAEDWDYWIRCAKVGVFAYLPGPMVIYRTHDAQVHHDMDKMFRAGKQVLKKHFKSDPPRYQRALASWYALSAKARWATAQHLKTGVFLAFSAFHHRMAGAASRFSSSQGSGQLKNKLS